MKTIVSFTPNALDKDSRAFKMAASFAKWGLKSIVIEAKKSDDLSLSFFDQFNLHIISLQNQKQNLIQNQIYKNNNKDINPSQTNLSQNINQKKYIKSILIYFAKKIWFLSKKIGLNSFLNFIAYLEYRLDFRNEFKSKYHKLNKNIKNADILLLHSYEFFPLAYKLSKQLKAKLIYDIHDFYPEINLDNNESALVLKWIKPFQNKIQKRFFKTANLCLTVSNGLANKCKAYFGQYPFVIKNAYDEEFYQTNENNKTNKIKIEKNSNNVNSLKLMLNISNDDKIIVSVGNAKKGQHIEPIFNSIKILDQNIHFVIIGAGYERYHSYIQDDSLKNRLHFLGAIPSENIIPIIKNCDLGLLFYYAHTDNYQYCLPNGFFQMIAAGLPLIFSNELFEIMNLNQQFNFGLSLNIQNQNHLIENISKILNNDQQHFYRNNVAKAKNELSWQTEENKLKKLIFEQFEKV